LCCFVLLFGNEFHSSDPPPQPQRLAAALVPFSVGESTAVEKRQRGLGEDAKMECSGEKLGNRLPVFWKK
jgi:hypothetical protein